MTRFALALSLFLGLTAQCFSFSVSIPSKEVVHVFANGKGDGRLVYQGYSAHEPPAPACLLVREDGSVYVSDFRQNAVLLFDKEYQLRAEIGVPTDRLVSDENRIIGWNTSYGHDAFAAIVSPDWKVEYSSLYDWSDFIFWLIFDGQFVLAPDGQEGVRVWKIGGVTLQPVELNTWLKVTKSDAKPFRDRYIASDRLGYITGIAGGFFRLNGKPQLQPKDDSGQLDTINYNNGELFGIDQDANRYFDVSGQRMLVVDKSGNILRVFKQREGLDDKTFVSFPTITKNGDIYYIESSPAAHKLIRIKRDW